MPPSTGYARHFEACNRHDMGRFIPFHIDGKRYGFVAKDKAAFLLTLKDVFAEQGNALALAPSLATFDARSEALMRATQALTQKHGRPLRHEFYGVSETLDDEPVAKLDRVAVPWFGTLGCGVHVNGFVRKKDGLCLWVGKRAADRPADPGKLDNMIGGGKPYGFTPFEAVQKEAYEEAGIEAALAQTAEETDRIRYRLERPEGLRNDIIVAYDIELPESFTPRNTDGEVAAYSLMPAAQVAQIVRDTDDFKFNCPLVIIGFLLRHGLIGPEHPEYGELKRWLKRD